MALEVLLEHHEVPKKTQFGTVMRSLGQDKVYVKNDEKIWKHCGFAMHGQKVFVGLVNFPHELGAAVAAEISKQKKDKYTFGGAPVVEPLSEEDED